MIHVSEKRPKFWHRIVSTFRRGPNDIGRQGEKLAADYLIKQGYRILERNLTTKQGELDLVATTADQMTVVFVEVKTSQIVSHYHLPEFRVDHRKQRQIISLAAHWCRRAKLGHLAVRFDVIGVNIPAQPPEAKPIIRHIQGAFESQV
jgi:putative endonuclease